jgi:hypothetical protein
MSWGGKVELADLDPKKTATMSYRVREGDFRVEVVFRSEKRLSGDAFYVTPGFNYKDQVTVTGSEIQVTHTPMSSP